jgi:archaellum component FlaG (FlaF/FlaG flagellin family)
MAAGKAAWAQTFTCQAAGTTFTCSIAAPLAAPNQGQPWTTSGTNIYTTNAGNTGIGTTSPAATLDVNGTLATSNNITITSYDQSTTRLVLANTTAPGRTWSLERF